MRILGWASLIIVVLSFVISFLSCACGQTQKERINAMWSTILTVPTLIYIVLTLF